MSDNLLFKPFQLGNLQLKNRIVMAPMTRNFSPNNNIPGDNVVDYYRRRAEGGVGLELPKAPASAIKGPAAIQGCLIFMVRSVWRAGRK